LSLVLSHVVFFKLLLLFVISQLYHLWWIKIFIRESRQWNFTTSSKLNSKFGREPNGRLPGVLCPTVETIYFRGLKFRS